MKTLKDQVAIVTGASTGLGKSVAIKLTKEGVKVVLVARNEQKLNEVKEAIINSGGTAEYFICDVGDENQIKSCVEQVKEKFGGIDILINNAGIAYNKKLLEHSKEEIKREIDTNLLGTINFSHEVLPTMQNQKHGQIVNVGSVFSTETAPYWSVYCATKFAIKGFTEGLRREMEKDKTGVRVMGLYPGSMDTNLTYANNIPDPDWSWAMKPDDVADSVIFMLRQEDNIVINQLELRLPGDE